MNIKTVQFIGRQLLVETAQDRNGWPIAVIQADPTDPNSTPEDRKVRVIGDDWALALPHQHIRDVTDEDVRAAMNLPDSFELQLTSDRVFPEYAWISTQMLDWMDAWRREALAEADKTPFAKAS